MRFGRHNCLFYLTPVQPHVAPKLLNVRSDIYNDQVDQVFALLSIKRPKRACHKMSKITEIHIKYDACRYERETNMSYRVHYALIHMY